MIWYLPWAAFPHCLFLMSFWIWDYSSLGVVWYTSCVCEPYPFWIRNYLFKKKKKKILSTGRSPQSYVTIASKVFLRLLYERNCVHCSMSLFIVLLPFNKILFTSIFRRWKMLCTSSVRKPLFKQSLDLQQRCVGFCYKLAFEHYSNIMTTMLRYELHMVAMPFINMNFYILKHRQKLVFFLNIWFFFFALSLISWW